MKLRLTKFITVVALTMGAIGLSSCYHHHPGRHLGHQIGEGHHKHRGNGHDHHDHH
ncbi:MAG: hypothetical protein ACAH88_11245 [Roseimicrobium sp.]